MFTVSVNSSGVLALLDQIAPRVHDALLPVISADAAAIQQEAQALAADGPLRQRSGRYAAAIKQRVYDSRKSIYGKVFSRDPRAPLFEFGGSQKPRDILPDTAKALKFAGSAGAVYAAIVHRPAVSYEPRPTIHAAFDARKSALQAEIESVGRAAASDVL